jgi:hypothetical protein
MRKLSLAQILFAWEDGQCHPIDWALRVLFLADPDRSWEELADMPMGRRDKHLLELRELLFGPRLDIFAECPRCAERLEFAFDSRQARALQEDLPPGPYDLEWNGVSLRFRLPTSRDLAAVVNSGPLRARQVLLQRCLLDGPTELAPEAQAVLAARMSQFDPLADIQFALQCPACNNAWSLALDVPSYLYKEIASLARRLLREVHLLAKAYGWSEDEILALSPTRRRAYLEMVLA